MRGGLPGERTGRIDEHSPRVAAELRRLEQLREYEQLKDLQMRGLAAESARLSELARLAAAIAPGGTAMDRDKVAQDIDAGVRRLLHKPAEPLASTRPGDCAECELCRVGGGWARFGYGGPDPSLCRVCSRRIDIDIASMKTLYHNTTDGPPKYSNSKSTPPELRTSSDSAAGAKLLAAKTSCHKHVRYDGESDEEYLRRMHQASSWEEAAARSPDESIEDYVARLGGLLDVMCERDVDESIEQYAARLQKVGLFDALIARRIDESEEDWAYRLRDLGLFEAALQKIEFESEERFTSRRASLLKYDFRSQFQDFYRSELTEVDEQATPSIGRRFWNVAKSKVFEKLKKVRTIERLFFDSIRLAIAKMKQGLKVEALDEEPSQAKLVNESLGESELALNADAEAALEQVAPEKATVQEAQQPEEPEEREEKRPLKSIPPRRDTFSAIASQVRAAQTTRRKLHAYRSQQFKRRERRLSKLGSQACSSSDAQIVSEMSQVAEYLTDRMTFSDDKKAKFARLYERSGKAIDTPLNLEEMKQCLRLVNRKLQDDNNQIDFCLMVLDIVTETQQVDSSLGFDFRLFCTVAALFDRVGSVQAEIKEHVNALDFRNLTELRYKIVRARSIFYLAEGAREGGSISFDELEVICKAGGLPPMVAVTMAESLREIDQTDVQFVDFLAYLPLFIAIHDKITSNAFE